MERKKDKMRQRVEFAVTGFEYVGFNYAPLWPKGFFFLAEQSCVIVPSHFLNPLTVIGA
jgi:hypothetical protein